MDGGREPAAQPSRSPTGPRSRGSGGQASRGRGHGHRQTDSREIRYTQNACRPAQAVRTSRPSIEEQLSSDLTRAPALMQRRSARVGRKTRSGRAQDRMRDVRNLESLASGCAIARNRMPRISRDSKGSAVSNKDNRARLTGPAGPTGTTGPARPTRPADNRASRPGGQQGQVVRSQNAQAGGAAQFRQRWTARGLERQRRPVV